MSQLSIRIPLIAFLIAMSVWAVSDPSKFKKGPDLEGGTILIYQMEEQAEGMGAAELERLVPVLKERLDPAGLKNYVIRLLGNDRVEIIIPESDRADIEQVKYRITTVGQLQFKIVATRKRHSDLLDRAEIVWPGKVVGQEGVFVRFGVWKPVDKSVPANSELITQAESKWPEKKVNDELWFVKEEQIETVRVDPNKHVTKEEGGRRYVLAAWNNDGVQVGPPNNLVKIDNEGNHYVLLVNDRYNVTGQYLTKAERTFQQGNLAVNFRFNAEGASLFYNLTREYEPEPDGTQYLLGVVLDNRLRSAPALRQRISDSGVIEGNFTDQEITEYIKIFNSGRLPVVLKKEPSSVYQISATLGEDTLRKAWISMYLAIAIVIAFMIVYYRFAGCVAVLGLMLNVLFTVALMVVCQATWTLPGLAGLVLTVGMSVDANVLIFERLREELDRGASLKMAIRNAYDKAWSTIFDSNMTTIVTAIILFAIGTDQVKGFAVTLTLGLITSMFCAVFVTRSVFDLFYERRWINKLTMMRLFGQTNIDFLKVRRICYGISAVVIVGGLIAVFSRGVQNFDIDFTGGTMVQMHFKTSVPTEKVRELAGAVLRDVSVEEIQFQNEEPGRRYLVRTTERDDQAAGAQENDIRKRLVQQFRDYLYLPEVTVGKVEPIPAVASGGTEAERSPAFRAFAGGQLATVTLSEPKTPRHLRDQLNPIVAATASGSTNPEDLYALLPLGQPSEGTAGENAAYSSFQVLMRSGLAEALARLETQLETTPTFDQFTQFGPQVAGDTTTRALWAIGFSWLSIIAYVWLRFGSWSFGVAGVVALIHDVLVAVGVTAAFSILAVAFPVLSNVLITDMKVDLNAVAAVLTLIGYSINDTIVIFDRIREIRGKSPQVNDALVNRALNETLSRTIITSLLTFLAVVMLFVGCGASLRSFTFIMVMGLITGCYSTIYIASPVLVSCTQFQLSRQKRSKVSGSRTAASVA